MPSSRFTHASILATDLDESVAFYEDVFGMERVPSPNFTTPVEWLRVGDRTLHLFERDIEAAEYYHVGFHVGDFERIYEEVQARDIATTFDPDLDVPVVFELPDGSVQLYLTDPAGNLLEANYPRVADLDRSVVTKIVPRSEQLPQDGEAAGTQLYFEETVPSTPG